MRPVSFVQKALATLRERLDRLEGDLRHVHDDSSLLATLATADRALTPFAVTVGLERRAAVLRRRANSLEKMS